MSGRNPAAANFLKVTFVSVVQSAVDALFPSDLQLALNPAALIQLLTSGSVLVTAVFSPDARFVCSLAAALLCLVSFRCNFFTRLALFFILFASAGYCSSLLLLSALLFVVVVAIPICVEER